MATSRFILVRDSDSALSPSALAEALVDRADIDVLDVGDWHVFVRSDIEQLRDMPALAGWIVTPERSVAVPDPRPKPVRRPGSGEDRHALKARRRLRTSSVGPDTVVH